ncbi:MAG: 1-acyl-sn-glycerol-3-phosphate acyltransferase [Oscillospiraceae bacterium]|nr:1-acyl-sn-glycerol-3-phosphate acyltransferase [Oscillospiraceae bacterium]
MEEKQQQRWCLPRHKRLRKLIWLPVWLLTHLRYPVKIENAPDDRQALILFNHQTALDQFLVALAFPQPVYFVASEDLFSIGPLARAMEYAVAPIPIKKQATDIRAVKTCLRAAKEGGTLAIAPEGNRTYSGRACHMNPAIGSLAKKLGLPVLLFRIEGGYGVHPRWSDGVRKGPMRAYISERIEPEELKKLRPEELCERIRKGLAVDETRIPGRYRGKNKAEFIERMLYVCPKCGLARFESKGDTVRCLSCGLEVRYEEDKTLACADPAFPYRFAADWYAGQEDFVNGLDTRDWTDKPLFRDEAELSRVVLYRRKELLRKKAAVALYGDRIVLDEGTPDELRLPFEELGTVTVLGKNKLNLYHGETIYQLKGGKRFNALKYVQICARSRNIVRGDFDDKFLGL